MNPILKELSLIGIVPVIKIDDAANAVPLAKALLEGGLPCAEVTFRTAAAIWCEGTCPVPKVSTYRPTGSATPIA